MRPRATGSWAVGDVVDMSNAPSTRYLVLFALDPANTRPAQRLVLMQRFLSSGLGPGVEVLDQAFFPTYGRVGFVILAAAESNDVLLAALEPCAGVFTTTVEQPESLVFDPAVAEATHGVVGLRTPHDAVAPAASSDTSLPVQVRLHAELPEGGDISSITLVRAPTAAAALSFGRSAVNAAVTETAHIQPMADYITAMRRPAPADGVLAAVTAAAAEAASAGPADSYTVVPLDSPLILVSSNEVTPFGATMPVSVAPRQAVVAVSGRTYVWQRLPGYFEVMVDWSNANNLWIHSPSALSGEGYNWSYPIAVLPDTPGIEYAVGTSSDHRGVQVRSDLAAWLHDLMTGTTYDAPWPEDGYTGGHLAAYRYIVGKLPGQTPPKKGTIKEPEEIQVIAYPPGAAFSAGEFDDVKNHLLVEIGHFATADQWFGPNGIINAVNTQISVLSAGDLTVAASMMSIPPSAPVTMSLDDIFGLISTWVAEIPVVGSVLGAVIDTGWTVAKAVIPAEAHQPIQATVARIADQLNEYLIKMVNSAQLQLSWLYADWGRLSEFSSGVATGRISVGAFYATGSGPGAGPEAAALRSADSGPPPLPPDYLHAAKNAWLTYAYQQLFATQHSVASQLSLTDQVPDNPWNPAAGTYHYTWSLPCAYTDSKGNAHADGYLVYDCSTDAPQQVLEQLFASDAPLHVNPIEFFGGFNGWPKVVPHYAGGYQNISNTVPYPPITRLGLDSWRHVTGSTR